MHTPAPPSPVGLKIPAPLEPVEIRMLILKLRWMGREDEAGRLLDAIAHLPTLECPVTGPYRTDGVPAADARRGLGIESSMPEDPIFAS